MANLVGKGFVNDNKGTVDKEGYWHVSVIMTETNYFDDETKEEETIEVQSMDKNFDRAHEVAMTSALIQLREEVYDAGFLSLIEARKTKHDKGVRNPDTITQ